MRRRSHELLLMKLNCVSCFLDDSVLYTQVHEISVDTFMLTKVIYTIYQHSKLNLLVFLILSFDFSRFLSQCYVFILLYFILYFCTLLHKIIHLSIFLRFRVKVFNCFDKSLSHTADVDNIKLFFSFKQLFNETAFYGIVLLLLLYCA